MPDRPLNICMFSNLFRPVVSGSSTQSDGLSRELAAQGHRPIVITARLREEDPECEEIAGVPVYRLPALRLPKLPIALNFPWLSLTFTPGNLRRIEQIFRRHRIDVIHLHNHMFDLSFSAVQMHKRFRIPLVITLHTMIHHVKSAYNLLLYPADRVFLRCLVADHAGRLICPDVNIMDYARAAFPRTARTMVPYGIDEPVTPEVSHVERLRQMHHLAGKRVILSLGHIHELRHRRELIAALPAIRKEVPNAVALIVGAETIDSPRKLANQLGVQDSVIFAGHVPHSDVPAYLALADLEMHLFYQDKVENTSIGIASMEAMAAGKVILAWANMDTYGRGILRPGENLIAVDPARPAEIERTIIDLLKDPARRDRVGSAARSLIRDHFSWERICNQTLQIYGEEIARQTRTRS